MDEDKGTGQPADKLKRTPTIEIKLRAAEYQKFSDYCAQTGSTKTDMARRAINEMLERQEQEAVAEVKDALAERLERMEKRLASLLARNAIDVGTIYQVLWIRSDPEKREALWNTARKYSVQRASRKLEGADLEIKELIAKEIAGDK